MQEPQIDLQKLQRSVDILLREREIYERMIETLKFELRMTKEHQDDRILELEEFIIEVGNIFDEYNID